MRRAKKITRFRGGAEYERNLELSQVQIAALRELEKREMTVAFGNPKSGEHLNSRTAVSLVERGLALRTGLGAAIRITTAGSEMLAAIERLG